MSTARLALRWTHPVRLRRFPAWTVPLTLVGLAYGIVLTLNIVALLTPPRLSLVIVVPPAGPPRVGWVLPGSLLWDKGVREGEQLLALDGRPPSTRDAGDWRGNRLLARTHAHGVVAVDAGAIRQGHDAWPLLALSPWFLLFGALVGPRAARPVIGRTAYALFASAAFALALAPATDGNEPVATVAEWVVVPLFTACLCLFFLSFPTPRGTPRLRAALAAPALVIGVCGVAAARWPALYDITSSVRLAIELVYLAVSIGLLIASFVVAREGDTRRGLTIISVGTLASILPFGALYSAPTLLGVRPLMAAEHAVVALALLPISFAYAILRHNVLHIQLLQRWLVHGLLWTTLLAMYVSAAALLYRLPLSAVPAPARSVGPTAMLAIVVGISFRWLYDRIRRLLDRLIFKDVYDYRVSLQRLSRDLSLASDLDTLGASLPATLRSLMNLDFAVLLVTGSRGNPSVSEANGAHEPTLVPTLIEAAHGVRDTPRVTRIAQLDLSILLVPLHAHDALVGHLCLGPKASGEPFRAEDHALLATLSGHLAAIVRNVQLTSDLRENVRTLDSLNDRLQRAQEEERARIAADLHDEALQTALHLRHHLIADGHNRAATAGHVALSDAVIDQLRAVCATVRPAALDELGLAAALEALALDLGEQTDVPILLDVDPEVGELALHPETELVLYRAAQEALNNGLRHAQPQGIQIVLRRERDTVLLRVADDGPGFIMPARVDGLAAAGHLGLAGLYHRVRRAGGQFSVISHPGRGTIVQVEFMAVGAVG